ncbi:MAG: hypothetical protein AAFZ15_04130 [Bacteroidota bacterium]
MAKSLTTKQVPKVHNDLQGFEVKINTFGEITTSFNIDKLNDFLNKNVDDKKLRNE